MPQIVEFQGGALATIPKPPGMKPRKPKLGLGLAARAGKVAGRIGGAAKGLAKRIGQSRMAKAFRTGMKVGGKPRKPRVGFSSYEEGRRVNFSRLIN